MTDKELLEFAAKAAGMEANQDGTIYAGFVSREWNPLTDDSDALRLAVKFEMEVAVFKDECHTRCLENGQHELICEGGDKYAATRRAIVRAAAEIGKAMK